MLSVKVCQKRVTHQVCVMDFVSHRKITPILIGSSVVKPVCLFDVYHSFDDLKLLNLINVYVTRFILSSNINKFSCTIKT